jgi:excisionase family DNA binding protein
MSVPAAWAANAETIPPINYQGGAPMARPKKFFAVAALSIDSAAVALDVPRRTIASAVKLGEIPAYSAPGRRVRILAVDLVEWVRTWSRVTTQQRESPHVE